MTFHTSSPEETIALGERIGRLLLPGDVVALRGTLAAGKTTITKGIARGLGVDEDVTSPTFTLVSEYPGRLRLYHMDVYRIDSVDDFLNLGAEEMLYGDGVCVVEWSEKVASELPARAVTIRLEALPDGARRVDIDNWDRGGLDA
ncbi:MAG TPA: tRNA (adenosine(37)-N6)-threonylcarbamoyltransferase complex ATPase subunit type 1 TsaE [Treponemataceae bacterium]|jgi:tRNA threonylcarbamoyladenosine biosynthesis protein TsaE|nr:tRNA (adenosine(37)-N6)-threonylcarbamoyltransferase complex ATPase subunit type 1 TsaE [Treponemataceae bacterium]